MNRSFWARPFWGAAVSAAVFFYSGPARGADSVADLTLEDCYRRALAVSETLTVSEAQVEAFEAQYRSLRSNILPHAGFLATEFYQDTSGVAAPTSTGGTFTAHHRPERRFYASQALFSGLREFAGLKSAQALTESARRDRERAGQLLYQDAAAAFYAAADIDQRIAVLSALRDASQDRRKDLRERVRIGRSRQSELLAADAQLATIDADLQDAAGQRASALALLSYLTGAQVASVRDATPDPAAPGDVESLVKKTPGRPDLLSRAAQLRSSNYSLTAARRSISPTIGVTGDYFVKRVGASAPIDWDVLLTLDAPIYRGGQVKAAVDQAAAARRASAALDTEAGRAAERDVRSLHASLVSTLAEVERLSEAARLAQETYRAQVKEYRFGLASNLDVLAALSALENAKLDYDRRRLEAKLLDVRLRVAVGDVR